MQGHSVPQDSRSELAGKIVAGGAASASRVAYLLGIDEEAPRFVVRAVAWLDTALEASVLVEGDYEVVFRIERGSTETKGLVNTDELMLYYRGDRMPVELSTIIIDRGTPRLAEVTLQQLSELLASDPERGQPGLPMPPGVDDLERPASLLDTWGADGAWADFFAGGEVARAQLDTIDPTRFLVMVQHGDAECMHVNPHGLAPIIWLVSYPWENRLRAHRQPEVGLLLSNLLSDQLLTTDLNENDVIMGNPGKVKAVLERAAELAKESDKSVFFSCTCVPVVTGEDVESELKRCQATHGCPIFYLTVSARSMQNIFQDLLVTRRLEAEKQRTAAVARSVNLVGFPDRPDVAELGALLGRAGITVNTTLLPELTEARVERLAQGALTVFHPNHTWQHLYDQLSLDSVIPTVEPPAPYGLTGTRQWLGAVIEALGVNADPDQVWEEAFAPHAERWAAVQEEARELRIGLVVRGEETHYLTRPDSTWGVPLPMMLEEMGFGLDILMRLRDRKSAARRAGKVHEVLAHPERHTIKGFNSFDMMLERLRESPCQAVCSYHFFDWRVTQAGKSPFSLQLFEMGIEGALRTAERLIGVCRTPFYRRYAAYLGRTTEGLRPGPTTTRQPRRRAGKPTPDQPASATTGRGRRPKAASHG